MSTNRTKIDWAYKQAVRIVNICDRPVATEIALVRCIAAILRRVEKRGREAERHASLLRLSEPKLTVATIRECKKQLEAVAIKPDADGNITFNVAADHYRR
jgi:hypothetical protein